MRVSSPRDEVLLFRQKDPKPFPPVRVPAGKLRPGTELYGCATRSEVQSHLSAQTMLAKIVEFGTAAPPRPKAVKFQDKSDKLRKRQVPFSSLKFRAEREILNFADSLSLFRLKMLIVKSNVPFLTFSFFTC